MKIAKEGKDAFYKGEIAKEIADYVEEHNGLLNYEDLATHGSTWVEPITTKYKGHDVYQLPPNGQREVTLSMLNMMKTFDIEKKEHNSHEYMHLITQIKKLAFADRNTENSDLD